jgi:hypothetical protein
MIFRFTLTHAVEGTKVISEPDGWESSTIGFERHPDFHSLVEYFKSSFNAYGSNGTEDGGRDWLLNVEKLHGADAEIDLLVEVDELEQGNFEELYTGQIAVSMFVESLDDQHLLQVVFTQKTFWTKFISRFKNKVNLKSTVSESGVTVPAANEIDLPLPNQIINATYSRKNPEEFQPGEGFGVTTCYLLFDSSPLLDELEVVTNWGNSVDTDLPTTSRKATAKLKYAGEHIINYSIRYAVILSGFTSYTIKWFYALRKENVLNARVQIGATQSGSATEFSDFSGGGGARVLSLTDTFSAGDEIYIYGELVLGASADVIYFPDYDTDPGVTFAPVYTTASILGKTVYPDTTTKAFLTHDVMDAIVDRITDQENLFYSEYLGNAETSRVYASEGCGSLLANSKGLHIRGYSLTEKPFFKSAEEWWQGINPIHNLGLGYEKVAGVDVIRVERKEHFYDDSAPLVYLSNVYNIKRSYDPENQFNQVEIGYDKWQSQAATGTGTASGIDDPQTKHTYNTRFKKIGKKITLFSKWVAASLTLETTRRVVILKSANYTYDDETFVIALKNNGDGTFEPELDENFSTLTNLLNKETRYNSRLTPGRNLLRWLNYLSGCLQSYLSSSFKFASGEGNFDMTSQMSTSCLGDSTSLSEKGDVPVGTDFLFIPMPYEINHYLTWEQYKLIRDNKNLAIGISQTTTNYKKFFIKTLEYQIGTGLLKMVAWPKEPFDIARVDFEGGMVDRYYEAPYEEPYE